MKEKDLMRKKSPVGLKIVIISLAIIAFLFFNILIRTYLCIPYRVQLGSMEPTLHGDNMVLVNKVVYQIHSPRRGDIVVFNLPDKSFYTRYIKRIIGIPGDSVEIKDGYVYINDVKIQEPYLDSETPGQYGPRKLGLAEYFVLGDKRDNTFDSREFGPIQMKDIMGKAFFILLPYEDAKFL